MGGMAVRERRKARGKRDLQCGIASLREIYLKRCLMKAPTEVIPHLSPSTRYTQQYRQYSAVKTPNSK
jgi:hypothetical protein